MNNMMTIKNALENVLNNTNVLWYASYKLKADKDVVLVAIKENASAIYFASSELINHPDNDFKNKAAKTIHKIPKSRLVKIWNKIKAGFKSLMSMVKRALKLSPLYKNRVNTEKPHRSRI